jgi:S1-C subfamily serine protease
MPRIVKVRCVEGGDTSEGSGAIQSSASGSTQWSVYTNLHVTGLNNYCTVSLPTGVDFVPTKIYSASLIGVGSYQEYPDIDFAMLRVSNATESFGEFPLPACSVADVKIGDRVTVFGYPSFGGDSLTVTDGIVSGIEYTAYGPIYKTSAKIDRGNSGGLAIDNNSKCGIGIPTWATSGAFDGLGYIQSWDMIKKSGNL